MFSTNLASDFFLCQKILSFVVENDMNFLCAVATDVWPKHNMIWCVSMHTLLVNVAGEQLNIATTTVNFLLMLHTELHNQCLSFIAEWLVKLGRDGIETCIL